MTEAQLEKLMRAALAEAELALAAGEVPIGAVVFDEIQNKIIGRGHNLKEAKNDPSAHAELLAMRAACQERQNWRLTNCVLLSTIEPCAMCAGALVQARVPRVVFGARDPRFGALGSQTRLQDCAFNHSFAVQEGILAEECLELLQKFFTKLRK